VAVVEIAAGEAVAEAGVAPVCGAAGDCAVAMALVSRGGSGFGGRILLIIGCHMNMRTMQHAMTRIDLRSMEI
jgi:hypothetical protein